MTPKIRAREASDAAFGDAEDGSIRCFAADMQTGSEQAMGRPNCCRLHQTAGHATLSTSARPHRRAFGHLADDLGPPQPSGFWRPPALRNVEWLDGIYDENARPGQFPAG
jgi:hypothetical protein